jgi:protein XagA
MPRLTLTIITALSATLILLTDTYVYAGAWTQPAGSAYVREGVSFYSADEYFDRNGDSKPGDWSYGSSKFTSIQWLHISEYGLRDDLTAIAEFTYKNIDVDRGDGIPNQKLSGFGDVRLGLKRRLTKKPLIISVQAILEVPTGYDANLTQVELDRGRFYRLGDGEVDVEGRVLLGNGLSFLFMPAYWNVEFGYKIRGGEYANDFIYSAAAGFKPLSRLWLRGGFSGVEHLADDETPMMSGSTSSSASYVSAGVAATVSLTRRTSVEIGYSTDVEGVDTLKGRAFEIAVEIRR